jgi:hypothetical protein
MHDRCVQSFAPTSIFPRFSQLSSVSMLSDVAAVASSQGVYCSDASQLIISRAVFICNYRNAAVPIYLGRK